MYITLNLYSDKGKVYVPDSRGTKRHLQKEEKIKKKTEYCHAPHMERLENSPNELWLLGLISHDIHDWNPSLIFFSGGVRCKFSISKFLFLLKN